MLKKITNFLFVTTQIAALAWVSISYLVAGYATVVLGQPFPVETLSAKALDTITAVVVAKVVGNIFEHNDSKIFGESDIWNY